MEKKIILEAVLDYLVCEFCLMREFQKEYPGCGIWGWLSCVVNAFFLLGLLHWSKQFIEGHLMGVSLCSVLDDWRKAACFEMEILIYQLQNSARMELFCEWVSYLACTLLQVKHLSLKCSRQFLCSSVLLKLVRRCSQSCRIQAILLDKSSSPLIPTLPVVT